MTRLLLTLCLISLQHLYAFDLVPLVKDNALELQIKNISLPETFEKDVKSGLKNFFLFTVYLNQPPSENVAIELIEVILQYDLWDESFSIKHIRSKDSAKVSQAKTMSELRKKLSVLFFDKLFLNAINQDDAFQIKVNVVLNPIEQEKVKHIKKWILKNSVQLPNISVNGRTSLSIQNKHSSPLLETLFNQIAEGNAMLGAWKATNISKILTMQELVDEKK